MDASQSRNPGAMRSLCKNMLGPDIRWWWQMVVGGYQQQAVVLGGGRWLPGAASSAGESYSSLRDVPWHTGPGWPAG